MSGIDAQHRLDEVGEAEASFAEWEYVAVEATIFGHVFKAKIRFWLFGCMCVEPEICILRRPVAQAGSFRKAGRQATSQNLHRRTYFLNTI